MELKELKKKKESDLHKILEQSRDKLRDLRFKDASKQLKDVRQIRKTRETIARILTLLNKQKTDNRPAAAKAMTGKQQITGSKIDDARSSLKIIKDKEVVAGGQQKTDNRFVEKSKARPDSKK